MSYTQVLLSFPPKIRFPRHTHSCHAEDSPKSVSSLYQSEYVHGPNATASIGHPAKISHHLFPMISKFEALDALSQEIHETLLRPAHLQTTPTRSPRKISMRRGGLDGPTSMKLEDIFSPTRRSRRSGDEVLVERMIASPPATTLNSCTAKRMQSGRLTQFQTQSKVNVRVHGDTAQNKPSTPRGSELRTRIPTYTARKGEAVKVFRGNSTVKDRVKFFDGSVEQTSPSNLSQNPRSSNSAQRSLYSLASASSSIARLSQGRDIAPTTPTRHTSASRRSNVIEQPLFTNGPRPGTIPSKIGTSQTSAKSSTANKNQRRPPIEMNTPNPFSRNPHTHPPTRQISPATITDSKTDKSRICHPLHGSSNAVESLKKHISPESRGRQLRVQEPSTRRVSSVKRTDAGNNLEAPRRTLGARNEARPEADSSKSKDMKMLRERSVVAKSIESRQWTLASPTGTKIPKPRWQGFSRPSISPTHPVPSNNMKVAGAQPRIARLSETRMPSLTRERDRSAAPARGSRSIHDKIKTWEGKKEPRKKTEEAETDIVSTTHLDSSLAARKSIFENPWNEEVERQLQKRGLDGTEVQAVIDEIQDIRGQIEDHGSSTRPWKMVVAPRLTRNELSTQHDGEMDHSSGDMDMQIIIREARCGLAEPKPLRLMEMKRMILLCRERVSSLPIPTAKGCKEKGKGLYPMKA